MDDLEETLRLKYGEELIPKEDVESKLMELVRQGYLCAEDIKYIIPMSVSDFIYYVNDLRRNFLYSDYEFKDFDSFKDQPFYSFIDNLKEKTQLIISENVEKEEVPADKSLEALDDSFNSNRVFVRNVEELELKKADIVLSVIKSYIQSEGKIDSKKTGSWFYILALVLLWPILLLLYTPKPF